MLVACGTAGLLLFAAGAYAYLVLLSPRSAASRQTQQPGSPGSSRSVEILSPEGFDLAAAHAGHPPRTAGSGRGGKRSQLGVSDKQVARERAARPGTFATLAAMASGSVPTPAAPLAGTEQSSYLPPLIREGPPAPMPAPYTPTAAPPGPRQQLEDIQEI